MYSLSRLKTFWINNNNLSKFNSLGINRKKYIIIIGQCECADFELREKSASHVFYFIILFT